MKATKKSEKDRDQAAYQREINLVIAQEAERINKLSQDISNKRSESSNELNKFQKTSDA